MPKRGSVEAAAPPTFPCMCMRVCAYVRDEKFIVRETGVVSECFHHREIREFPPFLFKINTQNLYT